LKTVPETDERSRRISNASATTARLIRLFKAKKDHDLRAALRREVPVSTVKPSPFVGDVRPVAQTARAEKPTRRYGGCQQFCMRGSSGATDVTLKLEGHATSGPYAIFNSDEASANRPELVIS
jgi:hypothetical protein